MSNSGAYVMSPGAELSVGPHGQLLESTGQYAGKTGAIFAGSASGGRVPRNGAIYASPADGYVTGPLYASPADGYVFEGTINTVVIMGLAIAAFLIYMKKG